MAKMHWCYKYRLLSFCNNYKIYAKSVAKIKCKVYNRYITKYIHKNTNLIIYEKECEII